MIVNLLFCQLLAVSTYAESQESESISVVFLRGSGQNINHENIDDRLNSKTFGPKEEQFYAFFDGINKRTPNVSKEFISFHNSYHGGNAVDTFYLN
jgi:hypothetical protein